LMAGEPENPLAPKPPHFKAKAKRVIFLFMTGGVSHIDTFDPKPYHGQSPKAGQSPELLQGVRLAVQALRK